ncbi:hypothetical protein PHLGIDRAFT_131224 [Phlebiopsis gigantea 11061_1 CR5-6]|uniref:F-box domain-containing protein n=1 Tax=Phlebiopsis gigantea (strain 11061_1 CR5-6) TaxID=745531 RepID=A0A0C3RPN9_PHLG1|nr:hypothetical protein PHLGIDRAFT_131224 [Phlebiopsis gigantea 11061_1 CR5-6]
MSAAASRLPEELIREILSYLLATDETTFCAFTEYGRPRCRGSRWRELVQHRAPSRTRPLLVSKQWLRIGTPLLYEKVFLFETSRTKIMAQLVKANPAVGRAIRYLRLEGGMGKDFSAIVKHAPNIHTLWITANVRGADSIAGLRKAAQMMQPRTLYFTSNSFRINKAKEEIEKIVSSAIAERWTSLESAMFCDNSRIGVDLSRALCSAPALREIFVGTEFFFLRWIEGGAFATVAKNESLECVTFVRILSARKDETAFLEAAKARGLNEHEIGLFKFVDPQPGSAWVDEQDPIDRNFAMMLDPLTSDEEDPLL